MSLNLRDTWRPEKAVEWGTNKRDVEKYRLSPDICTHFHQEKKTLNIFIRPYLLHGQTLCLITNTSRRHQGSTDNRISDKLVFGKWSDWLSPRMATLKLSLFSSVCPGGFLSSTPTLKCATATYCVRWRVVQDLATTAQVQSPELAARICTCTWLV